MTAPNDLSRLTLGTAPDSWGVWFAQDPHQVGWQQYLDEVAAAGYLFTELGPQGFLPQDPARLRDELAARGLAVCGGTVFAGLHKGKEALDKAKEDFAREARLLREVGAEYLVHLPDQYTDQHGGALTESADIDPEQWTALVSGTGELARYLLEEFGVKLVFHPHADTHVDTQDRVERFLRDTDPRYVNLCLDTGHLAYAGVDPAGAIRSYADRLAHVHFKDIFADVHAAVIAERIGFWDALAKPIFCPVGHGVVDIRAVLQALAEIGYDGYATIEQDRVPGAGSPLDDLADSVATIRAAQESL
jgi:inosose dehydratase